MNGGEPEREERQARALTRTLLLIALVVAVVGSLGAPLITSVATTLGVSLAAAQWTLTVALLTGAVAARGNLAGPLLAMSLLGLGVGGFSAAMPAVILQVTPEQETASAMGVNQVVRSTGFSLGSTLSALVLAAYTAGGAVFPASQGYATAALAGAGATALALVIGLALLR